MYRIELLTLLLTAVVGSAVFFESALTNQQSPLIESSIEANALKLVNASAQITHHSKMVVTGTTLITNRIEIMVTQLKTLWNHHQVQNARSEFESYIAAVLATLTRDLFSASKEFWTYHLSGIGVLLVLVLTINSILTASELLEFYAIASATWAAGLLVAGLILRSHYKNAEWETQSQAMVLIKTIASCLFFSFFITLVMSISSMTHDFDAFFRYSSLRDDNPSSIKLVIEFFFLNWISTSFYLLA